MVERIDKTGGSGYVGGPRPVDTTKSDQTRYTEQKPQAQQPVDKATISTDAAEAARYQEMARLHLEAFGPSDRSAKLDEVRERLTSGYYDQPEVLDQIAGNMVEGAAADHARASDLEIAKRRSEEGFYDKPEVIEKTAENVLKRVLGNTSGTR